ncbi:MAG: hypothetical protein AB3X44_17315 [Leptothrix sp. (in: b-proteobacteria)]
MKNPLLPAIGIRQNCVAVLFFCAGVAYGPASQAQSGEARQKAVSAISELMDAARAGGYSLARILGAMLTRGEVTSRVAAMADEAMRCAGADRVALVRARHGL